MTNDACGTKVNAPEQLRAARLAQLPPYLFVQIDRRKRDALAAGRDVIDFGVGDPDRPTPDLVMNSMAQAIRKPLHHRYPPGIGIAELRTAIADYFHRRFAVRLDPASEVLVLIGAKEGIGHLPLSVVDPGDGVLVPDPGYPVYHSGARFAAGRTHPMPLHPDRGWLPALDDIPADVAARAKLMWLNYPNNPTTAVAPLSFFKEAVAFAKKHNILVAQDAAYSEVYFDQPPPSILQIDGAERCAVEFHSFSKTFNMTGWRLAFAVGCPEALTALAAVKNNLDSGVFGAVQEAGIAALNALDGPERTEQLNIYRRRRDLLVAALRQAGWQVNSPSATIYVWAKCPGEADSMRAAMRLLEEADVVAIPGVGFGPGGEGYLRFSLTVSEQRTGEAARRIRKLSW